MLKDLLKKYQPSFHPVVKFNAERDKLLLLDFTAANKEISTKILSSTENFTDYINQKLESNNAMYGIGGYNEHRTVYSISKVLVV